MSKWAESGQFVRDVAEREGWTVFTDVPVTGSGLGDWSEDCIDRFATVGVRTGSPGVVQAFERSAFEPAAASGEVLHLIAARGHADRLVFGHLATRSAYLVRTWQPTGPVQPVALVRQGSDRPNVAPAFAEAGFAIEAAPGVGRPKRATSGGGAGRNDPWERPKPGEDELLHELWNRRDRKGWWLAEVPVGFQERVSEPAARRVDAVVVATTDPRHSAGGRDLEEFQAAVEDGAAVELIEAKRSLNADVIGQLLCGRFQFAASWSGSGPRSLTACVGRDGDEAVQWFCAQAHISIEVVDRS